MFRILAGNYYDTWGRSDNPRLDYGQICFLAHLIRNLALNRSFGIATLAKHSCGDFQQQTALAGVRIPC